MTIKDQEPLLVLRGIRVQYPVARRRPSLPAVDGVSLSIGVGETLGLVGESGSGKTTIGRAILGRAPVTAGDIRFDGRDITHADPARRRALGAELQMIFQNPYGSLNPARTVGQTLAEMLRPHVATTVTERTERAGAMLEKVGLPREAASRFPASFSGGQRQRIAIARALMVTPRLVICDEPVSALDISVQAQVLNLLRDLQEDLDVAYLFISHDITVVRHVSHRIAVIYRGRIVELGNAGSVHAHPAHPYSQALLAAAPIPDPVRQRRQRDAAGRPATPMARADPSGGCAFANRCPHAVDVCVARRPTLELTSDGRHVACHRWRDLFPIASQDAPSTTEMGDRRDAPTDPDPERAQPGGRSAPPEDPQRGAPPVGPGPAVLPGGRAR